MQGHEIDKVDTKKQNRQPYTGQWGIIKGIRYSRKELLSKEEFLKINIEVAKEQLERRKKNFSLKENKLIDTNDIAILEAQINTLENHLQENESELVFLNWKSRQIEQGGALQNEVEKLGKELNEKKTQRKQQIAKLKNQIESQKEKIIQLGFGRMPNNSEANLKEIEKLKKEKKELQEKACLDSREIERLSKRNKELEEENQALLEQLSALFNEEGATLEEKIKSKQGKLTELKSVAESKLAADSQKATLETLLIVQKQITRLSNSNSQLTSLNERQLQRARDRLRANLSEEEINEICQAQIELIKLKMELEKKKEQQFEAHTSFPPRRN